MESNKNKFISFLSLNIQTKRLLLEAFIFLGWARLLKTIPFKKIAPKLGKQMEETSYTTIELDRGAIKDISHAVNLMSQYTLWESMCLVKAIAAMKMLERRKIESTLYLGTAKDEHGRLIAHAWLRSGCLYLTGFEEMHKFTVINSFAKKISK